MTSSPLAVFSALETAIQQQAHIEVFRLAHSVFYHQQELLDVSRRAWLAKVIVIAGIHEGRFAKTIRFMCNHCLPSGVSKPSSQGVMMKHLVLQMLDNVVVLEAFFQTQMLFFFMYAAYRLLCEDSHEKMAAVSRLMKLYHAFPAGLSPLQDRSLLLLKAQLAYKLHQLTMNDVSLSSSSSKESSTTFLTACDAIYQELETCPPLAPLIAINRSAYRDVSVPEDFLSFELLYNMALRAPSKSHALSLITRAQDMVDQASNDDEGRDELLHLKSLIS